MIQQSYSLRLRQHQGLQCPVCNEYNLVRTDDPRFSFVCPDLTCGYVIWARPPEKDAVTTSQEVS